MNKIDNIAKRAADAASMETLPLTGLKVIDITHARAGPTAVRHLADWGADVIRVDQPLSAPGSAALEDVTGRQRGSDYQNLHRNKRSLRLNLKDAAGRSVLMDLVKDADVVIENMRPAVKHRLGIAYEDLNAVNPRLIYGSISGFGQTGPYSNRPGLDQIAQGMTGLMSVTGHADGPPLRAGIAVGDLSAGNMLALAVMMALYERQQTGRGRWVHTSLIESLLFMLDFQAARWLVDREVPKSVGNEHPTAIPTGVFEAADGHITLAAPNSRMWPKLCEAIARPEWILRAEWSTRDGRATHREEIHAGIAEVIRTRAMQYWIDKLNAAGVTCGPIYTMDQVFDDEQIQLLGMSRPVTHPVMGELQLLASPLNFDGSDRALRCATPDGGADTDRILRDLGYGEEKIRALKAAKVC
ncbi:CoA transferase [Paraburkholderia sabiae]|uniref:CaiB/BaiF CoA transferase family protein n=1 Tax=Paraburkholderia sabiae TaxID=273251 RepID=UPI001CB39011|nr:CaiB/BaiF CoA-transferase family protein [Paraburkholderia sabiae]CAG9192097.1 CoA transferase [Paraburkholderia sabiae]